MLSSNLLAATAVPVINMTLVSDLVDDGETQQGVCCVDEVSVHSYD